VGVETPTNPLLGVDGIGAPAGFAHAADDLIADLDRAPA
jgi:hypothetical protein